MRDQHRLRDVEVPKQLRRHCATTWLGAACAIEQQDLSTCPRQLVSGRGAGWATTDYHHIKQRIAGQ